MHIRIINKDEDCISSFEYQNDALGRRSQRVDNNIDYSVAITNTFAYNQYSEVTNAIMSTNNYNFTMDDIGNRLFLNNDEYTVNELNQYDAWEIGEDAISMYYDLDGNMITNDTWQYTWNAENRMTSATNTADGTYVTYKYDYQGRMFEKVTNGDVTQFIWNGNHIVAELTTQPSNGLTTTNLYVWANGETLCADLGGTTVFYAHDANKNITDLVDTDGDSVAHYEYSPFGVITDQTGSLADDNPFRFSNEYFDETTGLVEYKFRPYIPPLGKFASRDPIEEQGGLNLYGIGGNDLINKFDLWGLNKSETFMGWANDALGLYQGQLTGVMAGAGSTLAWASSVGGAMLPIIYAQKAMELGNEMEKSIKKLDMCEIYKHVFIGASDYLNLDNLNMVKKAGTTSVLQWIDPGAGGLNEVNNKRISYLPINLKEKGALVYLVWQPVSTSCTKVWISGYKISESDYVEYRISLGVVLKPWVSCRSLER